MKKKIDFNQKIKSRIKMWTLFSISMVIAIPIMIIALVNLNWFIAIPFMALVTFNIIALPIGWSFLGILVKDKKIVKAVIEEQVFHIKDLSVMFKLNTKLMKLRIIKLIKKGYLRGFKLNPIGTELVNMNNDAVHKGLCKYCGAPIPKRAEHCPYCNGLVNQ